MVTKPSSDYSHKTILCRPCQFGFRFSLLALLLFFAQPGFSDSFSSGVDEYKKGEYALAAEKWAVAADAGHSAAQFNLAILYESGLGVEKHLGIAAHWYRTAAANGYDPAVFALGQLYYSGGPEFPRNVDEAFHWWLKGAERGDVYSQTKLAVVLLEGKDVPRDMLSAKRWLKQASQKHHQPAIDLLSRVNAEIERVQSFDGNWIKSQKSNAYTVEYYRGPTKTDAKEFVLFAGLSRPVIYQSQYGDFTVLEGVYANANSAHQAIGALPEVVKKYKPRPRIFSTIQSELAPASGGSKPNAQTPTATKTLNTQKTQDQSAAKAVRPEPKPQSNLLVLDEVWVLERDPKKYTVQMVRAETKQKSLNFINENGLTNAAIYHAKDESTVVIAGIFDSRKAAQAAITNLPAGIKRYGAFPQSFAVIHQEIAEEERPPKAQANVKGKPTESAPNTAAGPTQSHGDIADETWILAQDSRHFTMQMVRLSTYNLAVRFVKRHKLKQPAIYRTAVNNYDVIDGVYTNIDAVKQAIKKLPPILQKNKPFPRKFTKVKIALNPPTRPNAGASQASAVQAVSEVKEKTKPTGTSAKRIQLQGPTSKNWISGRKPTEYTISLFTARDRDQANRFVKEYNISNSQIYRKNDNAFLVIAGVFANLGAAQAAIDGLPDTMKFFNPIALDFARIYQQAPELGAAAEPKDAPASASGELSSIVDFNTFWKGVEIGSTTYTALLFSGSSQAEARQFVRQFGLSNSSVFETKANTFGVIAGVFPEKGSAVAAVEALPDAMKQYGPIPMLYSDLVSKIVDSVAVSDEKIASPANGDGISGLSWLMERAETNYTVRLFQGKNDAEARQFIEQYGLINAAIYPSQGAKSNVISGVFLDKKSAREGIEDLPEVLKAFKPTEVKFSEAQKQAQLFVSLQSELLNSVGQGSAWIRAQDPKHYTIEIHNSEILGHSINFVKKFAQSASVIYQTNTEKYKVIIGSFSSRKSAKRWIKNLPALQVKMQRPKAKKFSSVQKELASFDQRIEFD